MHWGRREAPERMFINFEYELNKEYVLGEDGPPVSIFIIVNQNWNKEYVLGEEGPSSELLHQFRIKIE